ncbi:MAG: heat-inducible transcriptional repressor HrcA [Candidatus Kapaibacteriales bacterium]
MKESKFNIYSKANKITLDKRAQIIFKAIIHLYISTAQPISSRLVAKYLYSQLQLSPATIRNVMAELEEFDLISHPHTSSGRIPTDLGYRYYVDSLIQYRKPSEREINIFKTEFEKIESKNFEDILTTASKVLGLLSKYLSIVVIPEILNITIEKIDIISLPSNRLLFVIALESNIIRTLTIEVKEEIDESQLQEVVSLVNERISGKSLYFVYKNFTSMISDHNLKETPIIKLFITMFDKLFINLNDEKRAKFSGTRYLLRYPEFSEPEFIKNIFQIIDDADIIVKILKSKAKDNHNITVLIGSETQTQLLENYSLIATRYFSSNSSGIIGLLGPKRMNYQRVINLVDYTSKFLSEQLLLNSM